MTYSTRMPHDDDSRALASTMLADPAAHSLAVLAGVAWLLQMLDAVTFLHLMALRGPAAELNPLVRAAYVAMGPSAIIALKAGIAGPVVLVLARMGRWGDRRIARVGLLVAAALGLLGALSNLPALPLW